MIVVFASAISMEIGGRPRDTHTSTGPPASVPQIGLQESYRTFWAGIRAKFWRGRAGCAYLGLRGERERRARRAASALGFGAAPLGPRAGRRRWRAVCGALGRARAAAGQRAPRRRRRRRAGAGGGRGRAGAQGRGRGRGVGRAGEARAASGGQVTAGARAATSGPNGASDAGGGQSRLIEEIQFKRSEKLLSSCFGYFNPIISSNLKMQRKRPPTRIKAVHH
ncbi:unnamed protein product, partial [Iphiclides podalirius]